MTDIIPFPDKATLKEQDEIYEYFVAKDKLDERDNEDEWQRQYELGFPKQDGEQYLRSTD